MDALSATFAALADPTRRAILARLARGEAHVGELARPFAISAPAISRHLRVLEQAGLIRREVDAQRRLCRLQAPALQAVHGWLEDYRLSWEQSLDRLVDLVESQHRADTAAPARRARPAAPGSGRGPTATLPPRRPRRKTR